MMRKHPLDWHRLIAGALSLFIALNLPIIPSAAAFTFSNEIESSKSFQLNLPSELAKVEKVVSGTGPTILHIQEPHGSVEAQIKIREILRYLKREYGFKLVLLEGNAFKLHPELLDFYPNDKPKSMALAENLAKEGWVSGPALFLAETPASMGYGIEDVAAYNKNSKHFFEIQTEARTIDHFLADFEMGLTSVMSQGTSKELAEFMKEWAWSEEYPESWNRWAHFLKKQVKKTLQISLDDPAFQIDWPMLYRLFTLENIEKKWNLTVFENERHHFLSALQNHGGSGSSVSEIKQMLTPSILGQTIDFETLIRLEQIVRTLPENFHDQDYPNIRLLIAHLFLKNELRSQDLTLEIKRLTELALDRLTVTEKDKQLTRLCRHFWMLKKLMKLEITAEEYEEIGSLSLRPSELTRQVRSNLFLAETLNQADRLFQTALDFYQCARDRDQFLIQNIEKRLRETHQDKAVVITGGFHAGPFARYFGNRDFQYALLTPNISGEIETKNYRDIFLKTYQASKRSTLRNLDVSLNLRFELRALHRNPAAYLSALQAGRAELRRITIQTAANKGPINSLDFVNYPNKIKHRNFWLPGTFLALSLFALFPKHWTSTFTVLGILGIRQIAEKVEQASQPDLTEPRAEVRYRNEVDHFALLSSFGNQDLKSFMQQLNLKLPNVGGFESYQLNQEKRWLGPTHVLDTDKVIFKVEGPRLRISRTHKNSGRDFFMEFDLQANTTRVHFYDFFWKNHHPKLVDFLWKGGIALKQLAFKHADRVKGKSDIPVKEQVILFVDPAFKKAMKNEIGMDPEADFPIPIRDHEFDALVLLDTPVQTPKIEHTNGIHKRPDAPRIFIDERLLPPPVSARYELRLQKKESETSHKSIESFFEPAEIALFHFRERSLRIQDHQDFASGQLAAVLTQLLGKRAFSRKDGLMPQGQESMARSGVRERRVITEVVQQAFQKITPEARGREVVDALFLLDLLEGPRTRELLGSSIKTRRPYERPLFAVRVTSDVELSLLNQAFGRMSWRNHIQVLKTEDLPQYVKDYDGGVIGLGYSQIPGLPATVELSRNELRNLAIEDRAMALSLIPSSMEAAVFFRGAEVDQAFQTLKQVLENVLPKARIVGQRIFVSVRQFIEQWFRTQKEVDIAA